MSTQIEKESALPRIPEGFRAAPVLAVEKALHERIGCLENALVSHVPPPAKPGVIRINSSLEAFPLVVDFRLQADDDIEIEHVWVGASDIGGDLRDDQLSALRVDAGRHLDDQLGLNLISRAEVAWGAR